MKFALVARSASAKGRIYAYESRDNFNDFAEFSLNCRFIEGVEEPPKRTSRSRVGRRKNSQKKKNFPDQSNKFAAHFTNSQIFS